MSDKKIMKTLNGYTVYDEEAHRKIDSLAGSAPGLVFDTVADMEAYVAEHHAELKVGQNLYIREVDVPDYWWDGTAVQELEVKVDLSGYAKQEEVDRLSEAKADKDIVYELQEGETVDDAPEGAKIILDSQNEPVSYNPVKHDTTMDNPVGVYQATGRLYVDAYRKSHIDAALGNYITDIAALVGGDA